MNDRLFALRLFTRVARAGSFSAAGRELGISQPSASRIVAALERDVGAALLTRTTRAVTLTEAGADYLARIEPVLTALEEADHAARGTGELRGVLRIALSSSFAVREVIPRLREFADPHPSLRIELRMNDQHQDLVGEGIDVALRFGELKDSQSTARYLAAAPRVLVASPDYLARAGKPKKPADLASHAIIMGPAGGGPGGWRFEKDGKAVLVRPEGRLSATINEATTAAAVAGMGIASMSHWGCRAELSNGTLVPVLADWRLGSVEVHAVFPAGRAAKPSARAFVEFLVAAGIDKAPRAPRTVRRRSAARSTTNVAGRT